MATAEEKKVDRNGAKPEQAKAERAKPPEGFSNETRPDIDGWLKAEPGLIVYGKIVSMFGMKGDDGKFREVLVLKLRESVKAVKKGGEVVELNPRQNIGISMVFALEGVRPYVEKQGDVWCEYVEKQRIKGGRTAWRVNLHCKGEKSAAVRLKPEDAATSSSSGDEDDLPF